MATKKGGSLSFLETLKSFDEASGSERMASDEDETILESNADDTNEVSQTSAGSDMT